MYEMALKVQIVTSHGSNNIQVKDFMVYLKCTEIDNEVLNCLKFVKSRLRCGILDI